MQVSQEQVIARRLFSPAEFAARSGLSLITVRRYLAEGKLPKYQPGGKRCRVMIPVSALSLPLSLDIQDQTGTVADEIPATELPQTNQTPASDVIAGPPPRWMKRK